MAITNSSRVDFIDYLKGLLILLVTDGHSIQNIDYGTANGATAFFADPVFQFIYMFHMPFFMLISGILLYRGTQLPLGEQFKRRASTLLVPTAVWSIAYEVIEYVSKKPPLVDAITSIPEKISALWYLPCLFLSWFVVAIVEATLKNKPSALRVTTMITLGALFIFLPEKSILPYFKYTFPFYCLGHLLATRLACLSQPPAYKNAIICAATVVFIICYAFWNQDSYVYTTGFALSYENIHNIVLRYVAALSGIILFAYVASLLPKAIGGNVICELGKASMYIYVMQVFVFKSYAHINIKALHNGAAIYILMPVVSFLLAYVLMKTADLFKKAPPPERTALWEVKIE